MLVNIIGNLKKELVVLFVVFILSVSLLMTSLYFLGIKKEQRFLSEKQMSSAQIKYRKGTANYKLFHENIDAYNKLQGTGLVADENRLNWLSVIDNIVQKYEIPMLKYDVKEINKMPDKALPGAYPDIDVFQSEMILNMDLLHEGDLLSFFNALKKSARGRYDVYNCQIKRNFIDINNVIKNKINKNISVQCELSWITIKNRRA